MELPWAILCLIILSKLTFGEESCGRATRDEKIFWESSKTAVVTSTPKCLTSSGRFILAICENGNWSNVPDCTEVSHDDTCKDLLPLDYFCAMVTMPQSFNDPCPPNFLKYYDTNKFDPSFQFWSAKRKVDDVFMHIAPDSMYGKEFKVTHQKSDCFVSLNDRDIPKYCDDRYHQICVLPKSTNTKFIIPGNGPVEVLLKFDRRRSKILVNIYNPVFVLPRMDDPSSDAVFCFTNADDYELKTPVKIKRIAYKRTQSVYQISIKHEHPGEYWCEVFDRKQNIVRSNTVIAYKKKKGHEYSLRCIIKGICSTSHECDIVDGKQIIKYLETFFIPRQYNLDLVTRVMKIFDIIEEHIDVVLHLTTQRDTNKIGEFYKISGILSSIPEIEVIWFRSAEYCLPEVTELEGTDLAWKLTNILEEMRPDKLCLNEKKIPYRRKCLGNFIDGAYWDTFDYVCNPEVEVTANTQLLYNISSHDVLPPMIISNVETLTKDPEQIIPLDVYLVVDIMEKISPTSMINVPLPNIELLDKVTETIDHLLDVNKTILMESQLELNATDRLLDVIEKYFDSDSSMTSSEIETKLNNGEVYIKVQPKFILHISKPFLSNISGVSLYKNNNLEFSEEFTAPIQINQTFDDLPNIENLEMATYVPIELLERIAEENGSKDNLTIITSIFYNDNLFNTEDEAFGIPQTKIISVKIPEYGLYLNEPFPLMFRNNLTDEVDSTCAYWQYGEYATNKTGHWSNLGGILDESQYGEGNLTTCYFNHLTHFALLIMNRQLEVSEDENNTIIDINEVSIHDFVLNVITIVGSMCSIIGILGIFLTAIVFQRWREKTGSKILIQLSLAILLEIVVLYIAGEEKLSTKMVLCTTVGISLHYVVLAKSSWMFVSAILQYLRFVKIFQVLPNRLILKAMLFSWGLPLIPVGLVAVLLPDYNSTFHRFCYPSNLALYLGLFLPVAIIVFANLFVFILIMRSIYRPGVEVKPSSSSKNSSEQNRLQIYLGILLFFMLGIPWVFGILAEIFTYPLQLICVYLFCLTATLQGCVLFMFYIVMDRDTRRLWITFFRRYLK